MTPDDDPAATKFVNRRHSISLSRSPDLIQGRIADAGAVHHPVLNCSVKDSGRTCTPAILFGVRENDSIRGTVIRSWARYANTNRQTAEVGDRLSLPAECHPSLGL